MLAENAHRWESEADRSRAEAVARSVVNRLLHEPTLRLKAGGSHGRLQLTRELFGLDAEALRGSSPDELDAEVRQLRRRAQ